VVEHLLLVEDGSLMGVLLGFKIEPKLFEVVFKLSQL
jgi:hypothetical protein